LPAWSEKIVPFINKKEVLLYSIPLLLIATTNAIFYRVDVLMLGYFHAPGQVALYRLAAQLALIIVFPLAIFNKRFTAAIAEYHHNNKLEKLDFLFKTITRWIFMVSFPIFLIIVLLRKDLILIFGRQYMAAWKVLIVASLAQLISALVGSAGYMLSMTANQKILLAITVATKLLNVVLNLLLIPRFGGLGAASATTISIALWNIFCLLFVWRKVKVHPFSFKIYKPLLNGIVSFMLAQSILNAFHFLGTIARISLGGLIFCGFYLLIGFLLKYEEEEIYILNALKAKWGKRNANA